MDRPISMSVKDYVIRKQSLKTNTPIKTIEAVVDHQLKGINKAIQSDDKFSVEMSGFGKWVFNYKRAKKKYEKNISKKDFFSKMLDSPTLTEAETSSWQRKLDNTIKWMERIKPKIDKCPSLQNT